MAYTNDRITEVDGQDFKRVAVFVKDLQAGAEGRVSLWKHRRTGESMAVKIPTNKYGVQALKAEIRAFKQIPNHKNIVRLIAYDPDWEPVPPALFLEFADLGDVHSYAKFVRSKGLEVHEMTLWKFLSDVSQALDWIHNHLEVPHVHGDLKPANILVFSPPGWDGKGVPLLPSFKICDVSRLKPCLPTGPIFRYCGTPEFGPPRSERRGRQAPPIDVFAIGGSLQWFALGVWPILSDSDFIDFRKRCGESVPPESALKADDHRWRNEVPTLYRPINASKTYQVEVLELEKPRPQYSDLLNTYYRMTMEEADQRISAKTLVDWFVPVAEAQIGLMNAKRRREKARQRLQETKSALEQVRNIRLQK